MTTRTVAQTEKLNDLAIITLRLNKELDIARGSLDYTANNLKKGAPLDFTLNLTNIQDIAAERDTALQACHDASCSPQDIEKALAGIRQYPTN